MHTTHLKILKNVHSTIILDQQIKDNSNNVDHLVLKISLVKCLDNNVNHNDDSGSRNHGRDQDDACRAAGTTRRFVPLLHGTL